MAVEMRGAVVGLVGLVVSLAACSRPPSAREELVQASATVTSGGSGSAPATGPAPPRPETGATGAGVRGQFSLAHHVAVATPRGCPIAATTSGGAAAGQAVTDGEGRYEIRLAPGRYVVRITPAACDPPLSRVPVHDPAAEQKEVTVADGWVIVDFGLWDGTKCLDGSVLIDTPEGQVPVSGLRVGMRVWVRDGRGRRIAGVVEQTQSLRVAGTPIELVLDDGRHAILSPFHPLADGRLPGDLRPGDTVDGAQVTVSRAASYRDGVSYDLRTSPAGAYWANGIPVLTTMRDGR